MMLFRKSRICTTRLPLEAMLYMLPLYLALLLPPPGLEKEERSQYALTHQSIYILFSGFFINVSIFFVITLRISNTNILIPIKYLRLWENSSTVVNGYTAMWVSHHWEPLWPQMVVVLWPGAATTYAWSGGNLCWGQAVRGRGHNFFIWNGYKNLEGIYSKGNNNTEFDNSTEFANLQLLKCLLFDHCKTKTWLEMSP